MRAGSPTGSAFRTTCSTTSSASRRRSCSRSPTATPPARRRSRASRATSRSSSTSCWPPRVSSSADALATGHYIQLRARPRRPRALPRPRCRARPELLPVRHHAGAARLADVSPRRLSQGARCARWRASFALPVADKSDSQDICFVPQGRYTSVIERLKPGAAEAGDIVHVDGRVLGRHGGIINYTIGQRRGSGIPARRRSTSCASMPRPGRSWSDRARACMRTGSPLGTSTGWATSRSLPGGMSRCRARALDLAAAAGHRVPVGRRGARCCCATANMASPRVRRACSMPMPARERGCWAADGSSGR